MKYKNIIISSLLIIFGFHTAITYAGPAWDALKASYKLQELEQKYKEWKKQKNTLTKEQQAELNYYYLQKIKEDLPNFPVDLKDFEKKFKNEITPLINDMKFTIYYDKKKQLYKEIISIENKYKDLIEQKEKEKKLKLLEEQKKTEEQKIRQIKQGVQQIMSSENVKDYINLLLEQKLFSKISNLDINKQIEKLKIIEKKIDYYLEKLEGKTDKKSLIKIAVLKYIKPIIEEHLNNLYQKNINNLTNEILK